MIPAPPLSEFQRSEATYRGVKRVVYGLGQEGPGVVLLHEIPGITPSLLRLAKMLVMRGFRVVLPSLFGTDGADGSLRQRAMLLRMCVSAEFAVFAANGSSPIVDWLRDLCRSYARTTGGPIGVVGLCITGGFALSLVAGTDGLVRAPVMSEPSLPFPLPFTRNGAGLHLSAYERASLRADPPPCLALRFTGDYRCRAERFDAYEELLGRKLVRIEIGSPDERFGIGPDAHSVLTHELSDVSGHPTGDAFERVVGFLGILKDSSRTHGDDA